MDKIMLTSEFQNLPKNWRIKELGEVCELCNGYAFKSSSFINKGVPVIRIGDIKNFEIDISNAMQVQISQDYENYQIQNGDLLIAMSGATTGKMGIYKLQNPAYLNQRVGNLKIKSNEIIPEYRNFALYALQTEIYKRAYGGAQPNISKGAIESLKIPLPPLEIQKRIVARLESAFEKIEKGSAHLQDAKTNLAKYKQSLLKSAFDGTLTAAASLRESAADEAIHKVDCHDLTSSKLAMTDKENPKLPQGWTIKTLGEIAQTTSGGTPSRKKLDYWNGNIKWLKSGELNDNYINEVAETITQSGLENSSAKIFSKGTLLIALYGATIGKLGILNLETSTNQAVCAIMPNKELETKYLFHFLFSIRNKMIKDAFGGAQSNISQTYLKQIKIPLPPLEIQKQIVKLLEKHLQHADKTGEFIESALNKAKQLKQSLLKSAFLGKPT